MKKKGLVLLVCLALVATLAVNGTFASELQTIWEDVEEAVSTLFQNFRGESATVNHSKLDVDIVSTDAGGALSPSNYSKDNFDWPTNPTGAVTRTIQAQNKAETTAYVRISIAVRKDMDVLKHDISADTGYTTAEINKDGAKYIIYNFDYTQPLTAGNTTPAITLQMLLTKETTNADVQALGSDFIMTKSFAIEAGAFVQKDSSGQTILGSDNKPLLMDADKALEAALGDIASFNPFN